MHFRRGNRTNRRKRSGQILVLAALALTVLMGFASLAIDVGFWYQTKRRMQTAADAAAIAASNALQGSQSGSYQSAAKDVASLNGFTDGQSAVTVTVGSPATPPNPAGQTYVEVDITQPAPSFFLKAFGYATQNIKATAISGTTNGTQCIYALDPTKSGSLSITGNATITGSCGTLVDSNSSSALSADGNVTLTTTSNGVVGNYTETGNITISPTPKTGIAPVPDPLASLQPPTVPTCTQASSTNSGSYSVSGNSNTVTVPPAVYGQGITISGNSQVVTFAANATYGNGISLQGNLGSVTFNPGQYQSGGSGAAITIAGNASTTFTNGNYTFCGPVTITGNNNVTLSPGLYYGGIAISGNATVNFNAGTYILAGGGLSVTGNSTISGTGVMFYNTTGSSGYAPIDLTGNETATLKAPTSGAFAGILFFQDRAVGAGTGSSIVGNSSSTFDGALYFPTTSVSYTGNSSGSGYTFILADTITITGNSTLSIGTNYSSLANGSPIKSSALYE